MTSPAEMNQREMDKNELPRVLCEDVSRYLSAMVADSVSRHQQNNSEKGSTEVSVKNSWRFLKQKKRNWRQVSLSV
jgi:hypothetical protein